ncbi:MAG: site-specific DNA-methyltransferase [Acidimicrobiales bacterium]
MPARKPKQAGPTPVEAITHGDKRANLPTADAQDFVAPEVDQPVPVRYPRDPTLDPQLVWKGKDALDGEDLVAEAPAIYIQEKIDPRVLIENLRQTAAKPEDEPELRLFDTFDGLPELDLVDFYQHQANWSNRMILGDSLNVMASLAEREALRGKVQMIYIDPPYGIQFGSNWQASTRKRDVKDGNLADASREVEQIKAFRDTWELGIHSYLTYLRDRLAAAKDLLTDSGSVFVQIGDENVHLVRSLMDEVFGSENFVGLVTYAKTTGAGSGAGGTDVLASVTDYLLWYAKDLRQIKYRQIYLRKSAGQVGATKYDQVEEADGSRRPATADERRGLLADARLLTLDNLTSQTGVDKTRFDVTLNGRSFRPHPAVWKTGEEGMARLLEARRVQAQRNTLRYVRYFEDFPAFPINNVWADLGGVQSRTDPKIYVVQTATTAIERCLLMTTDPGDVVLDPTCGSGTTAYVAEQWGRRWITIDTSRVALALARQRLMGARFPYFLLADSVDGRVRESQLTAQPLPPAEVGNDIRHGFVYERVQHISLKSIANNPDIKEGMSREEIDAAIRRHAEFELLFDKPYEDSKKVRVAGPFTVETLSPHRSLAFAGSAVDGTGATNAEAGGEPPVEDSGFEQTILANLRTAGIQNGRKKERLSFDTVETYAGSHIQAVGVRDDPPEGTPRRVGITIGPQYGIVDGRFIKETARETIAARDLDLLCVLAFAFDPTVLGTGDEYVTSEEGFANVAGERRLGRVPVLLVRMNADLVMGEELKKTGASNLFTFFGEPDIEIKEDGDQLRVVLRGGDVYDPNTGQVRSNDVDQIALWMIDTAYNEESFFVRHCYFTGGQDPFARLKRALKADIDEDAWASLYLTESRPFDRPETGKIAVKVINDYGDEVMRVFAV